MTLKDLHKMLSELPGHDNLLLEDYRIVQEIYDPGNPAEVHFYLTGPDTIYVYLTQIDQGEHWSLDQYANEARASC